MKNLDQWFADYGVSHKNATNKKIHYICVPVIVYSLLGIMDALSQSAFLDLPVSLALIFIFVVSPFYLKLSLPLGGLTVLLTILMFGSFSMFHDPETQLWVNVTLFVVAWVGQFIGHKIEGMKPSFLEDLIFLLIGPLWVMHSFTCEKLHKVKAV